MAHRSDLILHLFTFLILANCQPTQPIFECDDPIGCVEIAPEEPIKISALLPLSADMASQGMGNLQCIELALDDRGRQLLGHPVQLEIANSQCSAEGGTTAALKIVADPQIVAIIGPTCSSAAATAMKVISQAGFVMISSTSTAPTLTSTGDEPGPDWQPGFFRTAQNDAFAGRGAATFAFNELGVRKAATIDDGDPYTGGLTDTFQRVFSELGGELALSVTINKGDTDMHPVLSAVVASGAELVFFPVFRPEGDHLVLQSREVTGMDHVTRMTAEGLYFGEFIEAIGEAGAGLYFNSPSSPEGPAYEDFVSRYEQKYQELPVSSTPYGAHTYDAVNLLLDTIEKVANIREDGTIHIGRQALRDALYATVGYPGLTGNLTCDQYGDCGVIRLQVTRLDDPAAGFEGLEKNIIYTYPPSP